VGKWGSGEVGKWGAGEAGEAGENISSFLPFTPPQITQFPSTNN